MEAVKRAALPAEIVAVLVSDRRIAAIHLQFMQIAGPTDVITFQHGEIIISVETADRQATQLGKALLKELCLYLLHGYSISQDTMNVTDSEFRVMERLQRRLMRRKSGSIFHKRSRRQILTGDQEISKRVALENVGR